MSEPIEVTSKENAIINQEYATFGANPRSEQVKRIKQVLAHLETAEELLARMGAIYMEFNNQSHSDYCGALYASLETIREAVQTFKASM